MKKKVVQKETLVNFILDKSGSMESVKNSTISGFNEYVETLKRDGNNYSFSLTFFDTDTKQTYTNEPIKKVGKLDKENYEPNGNTALYDAVCRTIDTVKGTVKKGQKVLTVIMTDGEENSSKEYTQEQLRAKIAELEKTGNWSFVFLGANQDSWANAAKMGIPKMNTANFVQSDAGVGQAMQMMASNTRSFASAQASGTSAFFSQADQQNLMKDAPKSQISQHFSTLGNKSWEARKKKLLGE